MKLIQRVKGDQNKGDKDRLVRPSDAQPVDPNGDQYFVDEAGSAAIVGGRLYINGREAPPGRHKLGKDQTLIVDVDSKRKARRGR